MSDQRAATGAQIVECDPKQTAFLMSDDWGKVKVCEFLYEKRTLKSYCGCKLVASIVGKTHYLAERQSADMVSDTVTDALNRAQSVMRNKVEASKRATNELNSRLGEIEKIARQLSATRAGGTKE